MNANNNSHSLYQEYLFNEDPSQLKINLSPTRQNGYLVLRTWTASKEKIMCVNRINELSIHHNINNENYPDSACIFNHAYIHE